MITNLSLLIFAKLIQFQKLAFGRTVETRHSVYFSEGRRKLGKSSAVKKSPSIKASGVI